MNVRRGLALLLALLLCLPAALAEAAPADDGEAIEVVEAEDVGVAPEEIEILPSEAETPPEPTLAEAVELSDLVEEEALAPEEDDGEAEQGDDFVLDNAVRGSYGVDLDSEGYVTNVNPFYKKGYWGECTWYCWGRAYEKCGVELHWNYDTFGNAKDWFSNASAWAQTHEVNYSVGTEPRENSIAVSTAGWWGHVVFIERIADGKVYYSDSNGDAGYHCYGEGQRELSSLPYVGYIYLRGTVASGQCGDSVYWDLFADGVLELRGSGPMWDYYETSSPWGDYSWDEESKWEAEEHAGQVNIEKVVVHEGVTAIGRDAFSNLYMKSVSIPDSVTSLGVSAFANCYNLTSIDLPDGIAEIPDDAFGDCYDLTHIKLPSRLKRIGSGAFQGACYEMDSITLPSTLETIEGYAFYGAGFKEIKIPKSVTLLASSAFARSSISKVKVASGNATYKAKNNAIYSKEGDMLVYCAPGNKGTYKVAKGVRYILSQAFSGCRDLKAIELPEGVLNIGELALEDCWNLKSINIPASVVAMDYALSGTEYEGSAIEGLKVRVEYGSYAHSYCRAHSPINGDYSKYVEREIWDYVVTKAITRSGSSGTVTLYAGEKLQISPDYFNGRGIAVKGYSSKKKSFASVSSSGLVQAKAEGSTTITINSKGKLKGTLTVKVKAPYTPKSVSLNKKGTVKLKKGKTLQLKAKLKPDTAYSELTWASSNNKIAKVSANGVVTAVKKGTATIMVKTSNGKQAKVKIKVT